MPFYYYFLLPILLSVVVLLIYSFVLRKKNRPVELFVEALRDENSGHFEAAIITYENALKEVKKVKFNSSLKNKIIGKLKLLHTVLEYKNNFYLPQVAY
jgi:hypothetical protein